MQCFHGPPLLPHTSKSHDHEQSNENHTHFVVVSSQQSNTGKNECKACSSRTNRLATHREGPPFSSTATTTSLNAHTKRRAQRKMQPREMRQMRSEVLLTMQSLAVCPCVNWFGIVAVRPDRKTNVTRGWQCPNGTGKLLSLSAVCCFFLTGHTLRLAHVCHKRVYLDSTPNAMVRISGQAWHACRACAACLPVAR